MPQVQQTLPCIGSSARIVQVCLGYYPETGGSALSVRQFRDVLGGNIISFSDRAAEAASDVETVLISRSFIGDKFAWANKDVRKQARILLEQADLIVCHTLFRYHIQWAADIARRKTIPYWVVLHGSLDPYTLSYRNFQKELWMRLYGNSILENAAAVICATTGEKDKVAGRQLTMDARVVFWPVQPPACATHAPALAVRQQLGIPSSHRMLLFLGRLHPMKQPLETIRALKLSKAENVHLVIVGGDDHITREQCQRLAAELGMPNVHLIGPLFDDRKWEYVTAADGFISLSKRENFGFTVAEALMAAKPVIVTPGIDLAREFAPVRCGWLLESATAEVAAPAIAEFAAQPLEKLRAMGQRGQNWAQENLNPDRFRTRLVDLLAESSQKVVLTRLLGW